MKKQVIRIGDRVKIINNRWIKRIGYPIIWTDIVKDVEKDPRVRNAYNTLVSAQGVQAPAMAINGVMNDLVLNSKRSSLFDIQDPWHRDANNRYRLEFLRIAAMIRVDEMGFGGSKRTIHYLTTREDKAGLFWNDGNEIADYTGQVMEVFGKKVCKTGTRYSASSSRDWWSGHDDYEPAGLADAQTHVLLNTSAGWIETVDVELIKPAARLNKRHGQVSSAAKT